MRLLNKPGTTSSNRVRVPFPQIAANALELLRDAGNGDPPRTLIAAPTLIPRKSATPPR
jgi:LacI family transcriptional regulator